ncbi:hypothetical protein AVEN_163463-1 [Araneus ventricosus]|uniref:Uncharacterized protein n=1 Tax=Araneus ventricosus TaxID=182803 RepID=A0A4Y2JW48_ARAVE|nr:hypothetical protein AVEN_163463-1 [Araneus ventricosus]
MVSIPVKVGIMRPGGRDIDVQGSDPGGRDQTSDSLVQSEPSKVTMVPYSSTVCLYASRMTFTRTKLLMMTGGGGSYYDPGVTCPRYASELVVTSQVFQKRNFGEI